MTHVTAVICGLQEAHLFLKTVLKQPATLTLYQLVFASRDILQGYGIIYKVYMKQLYLSVSNPLA